MRITLETLTSIRNTNKLQKLNSTFICLLLGVATMQTKSFAQLTTNGVNRVKRGHGVLEDHSNIVATNVLHLMLRHLQQRLATIAHITALNLSWRHIDKTHDGEACY